MKTLTICLSEALKTELEDISREDSKSVSELVRESLGRYVALKGFRSVRKRILPFAEAQGLLTEEEVFSALS